MTVKVGQLKAHLLKYLRKLQESGEAIEVCVREKSVAYLTPTSDIHHQNSHLPLDTVERLQAEGITVIPAKQAKGNWVPTPGKTDDGLHVPNTVVAMRQEKKW